MKREMGKIALYSSIILLIFSILFCFLDYKKKQARRAEAQAKITRMAELDQQAIKRLSVIKIGMEKYSKWSKRYALTLDNNQLEKDTDGDGLSNFLEYAYGTDPTKADSDGDGFSDKQEIVNGFDPNDDGKHRLEARIKIEKLGIDVPMVWSQSADAAKMLKDLEKGVSHYLNTAAPGQNGNMIISGHSSNYSWAAGDFNQIFKNLNDLKNGDEIKIETFQQNGREVVYKYAVTGKFITVADDQKVFVKTENPTLTLSTCWPIGTNLKRLIVRAAIAN